MTWRRGYPPTAQCARGKATARVCLVFIHPSSQMWLHLLSPLIFAWSHNLVQPLFPRAYGPRTTMGLVRGPVCTRRYLHLVTMHALDSGSEGMPDFIRRLARREGVYSDGATFWTGGSVTRQPSAPAPVVAWDSGALVNASLVTVVPSAPLALATYVSGRTVPCQVPCTLV